MSEEEEHAIAPWDIRNPGPIWMRLTDPRNDPSNTYNLPNKYYYECYENGTMVFSAESMSEIEERYHVSDTTILEHIRSGKPLLFGRREVLFIRKEVKSYEQQ